MTSIGEGSGIVFLHAGVADRRMWSKSLAHFGKHNLAMAYDRRGFGETQSPDEAFSHVQDLKAVLDDLGLDRPVLVGCSQGGRLAVDFTLRYPAKVSAVVLAAPAISGADNPSTFSPEIAAAFQKLDAAEQQSDEALINDAEAHLWLDGPASEEGRVTGPLRDLFLDMNGIALAHPELTKEIQPKSSMDQLQSIEVPTLIVWGNLDFPHIQDRCILIGRSIPNATTEVIEECAHLVNLEQPKIFNGLVEQFVASRL
ncbi:alpha/beta fold hydrolase [Ruegeria sp. 2012CJ15-1]